MKIEIDKESGFCFGVVNAIKKAEQELKTGNQLYCLGDIVHNYQEVKRLESIGLETIDHAKFNQLSGAKVLLRAHGEPPSTYQSAQEKGILLIDATCPVVLRLQQKIRKKQQEIGNSHGAIVIFGKRGHAEVNGLLGQTNGRATIIETIDELDLLNFNRPIYLFSQTTKSIEEFNQLVEIIKQRMPIGVTFEYSDTICRQVANKIPHIKEFAKRFEHVFFVSGKKSSNGKVLFEECLSSNPNSYFISDTSEIKDEMIHCESIGICGATSTPRWLMEEVEHYILKRNQEISLPYPSSSL